MLGLHCIKSWSKTQSLVAKSSAEAELYATVKAASEALGVQTLLSELGQEMKARVFIDSSAAKSICEREGLDKVRHIEVGVLWLQEQEVRRRLPLVKVPGTSNIADLMTKHLNYDCIIRNFNFMNIHFVEGRAVTAPKVYSLNINCKTGIRDSWISDSTLIRRLHFKPRLSLFTPLDVSGYPENLRTHAISA